VLDLVNRVSGPLEFGRSLSPKSCSGSLLSGNPLPPVPARRPGTGLTHQGSILGPYGRRRWRKSWNAEGHFHAHDYGHFRRGEPHAQLDSDGELGGASGPIPCHIQGRTESVWFGHTALVQLRQLKHNHYRIRIRQAFGTGLCATCPTAEVIIFGAFAGVGVQRPPAVLRNLSQTIHTTRTTSSE